MPDPIAFEIFGITVRWYGVMIALGITTAFILAYKLCLVRGYSPDTLMDIFIVAVPFGIIGARLYYVIFMWDYYSQNLSSIFAIWNGGLAIHGGIIAGIIAIAIYMKYKNENLMQWLDVLAPAVLIAQAIGRWGNFFNQEAYGDITDVPWAMYIDGAMRHPTFLYESIWNIIGTVILVYVFLKVVHKRGDIAALYFIIYSTGRFFIESLRTDSLTIGEPLTGVMYDICNAIGLVTETGELRTAMLVSLLGVVLGILLLVFNRVSSTFGATKN